MIALPLAVLLLLAAQQQPASPQSDPTQPQRVEDARARYESLRQAAIHVNELAGNIHSETDARAFVDAVAEHVIGNQHPFWTTVGIRHRVAHAEYETVSDPTRLIPEQRIVDVWNEYVREIDAPEETLVTVAEVHNLRDSMYTSSKLMWKKDRFPQSLWIMPDVHAIDADGKVASGCRAVESLKILHDMFYFFQNVQLARKRVQRGILASDLAKHREQDPAPRPQVVRSQLTASKDTKPVLAAEIRYVQAHGERDYGRLLERLFAELFPAE